MSALIERLEARGFDKCYDTDDCRGASIGCSQCQALVINGTACHEHGCPNQTHECAECETQISKSYRLCYSCANDSEIDEEEGIDEAEEDMEVKCRSCGYVTQPPWCNDHSGYVVEDEIECPYCPHLLEQHTQSGMCYRCECHNRDIKQAFDDINEH